MALTDDEFAAFSSALQEKVEELGRNSADAADMNLTLQEEWDLLTDIPAATRYCESRQLARLKDHRTKLDDGRQDLDDEITRLEGRQRP